MPIQDRASTGTGTGQPIREPGPGAESDARSVHAGGDSACLGSPRRRQARPCRAPLRRVTRAGTRFLRMVLQVLRNPPSGRHGPDIRPSLAWPGRRGAWPLGRHVGSPGAVSWAGVCPRHWPCPARAVSAPCVLASPAAIPILSDTGGRPFRKAARLPCPAGVNKPGRAARGGTSVMIHGQGSRLGRDRTRRGLRAGISGADVLRFVRIGCRGTGL